MQSRKKTIWQNVSLVIEVDQWLYSDLFTYTYT